MTQLYINDIVIDDKFIMICVIVEIHLMNDLKINMLIDVNVFKSQKMILNFEHNTLIINNCQKIKIVIDSINRIKSHQKRTIRI